LSQIKFNLAIRGEYYNDENGVIINTETINGFQTYGYSLNFDYVVTETYNVENRRERIYEQG
jgi:dTDP-4-dehydrorhamnose 3,5-epimerase-like enzyme